MLSSYEGYTTPSCIKVGQGAISVWYDTWLKEVPLVTYSQFISSWPYLTVVQILERDTHSFLERHGVSIILLDDMLEIIISFLGTSLFGPSH